VPDRFTEPSVISAEKEILEFLSPLVRIAKPHAFFNLRDIVEKNLYIREVIDWYGDRSGQREGAG
jgi:hypothetical protein